MAKFNETKKSDVRNLAGGKAYKESKELALVSLLLTSFGDNKYYEKESSIYARLEQLIQDCDKQFVAKAIIYARKVFGMRTITHIASSILAKYIGGENWAKSFFTKVVNRVDDMTEIVACHLGRKQKVTNAMKKGFAEALGNFDEYQLAKYKCENKSVKLVDLVNIVHPIETAKNNGAIGKLINGELKSFDTWESELSAVGNDIEAKKNVWRRLINENKLGYFALLRNLRNIINLNDSELKSMALNALVNENAIKKSLVLPFRYSTAYNELRNIDSDAMRAISRACEIACNNVPKLDGKTLIALDTSGSMASVADIASLFTAVLLKSNDCDLITFSDNAKYCCVNTDDSVLTIKNSIYFSMGGTNFGSIFTTANKKYDRIVLLSDMQAWDTQRNAYLWGYVSPVQYYQKWKAKYNATDCKVYSFDLAGYGTLQLPEKDVCCLAGFSEKVFDVMKFIETDKNALINTIHEIKL